MAGGGRPGSRSAPFCDFLRVMLFLRSFCMFCDYLKLEDQIVKGFFCESTKQYPFAFMMGAGYKTIKTRNKNMLSALVGERVAIVETRKGKLPLVVAEVDVIGVSFCPFEEFHKYDGQHRVQAGSKYDCSGKGKWFYHLANPVFLNNPYTLPEWTVRHGRSWCEF